MDQSLALRHESFRRIRLVRHRLIQNLQRPFVAPKDKVGSAPVYVFLQAPTKSGGQNEVHRADTRGLCCALDRFAQSGEIWIPPCRVGREAATNY